MKNRKNPLIFVIEDSVIYKDIIIGYLKSKKYTNLKTFKNTEDCLKSMELKPNIIILDYSFEGLNGLEFMKKVQDEYSDTEFIFLSGQNSVEVAVNIMKLGASDYIVKNDKSPAALVHSIELLLNSTKKAKLRKGFQIGVIGFFVILFTIILTLVLMSVFIKDFKL